MRFESKHCFFKQWSSKLNFKNVCESLVNHNQLFECCNNEMGTEHPLFLHKELGPVSEVKNMDDIAAKIFCCDVVLGGFMAYDMQSK